MHLAVKTEGEKKQTTENWSLNKWIIAKLSQMNLLLLLLRLFWTS